MATSTWRCAVFWAPTSIERLRVKWQVDYEEWAGAGSSYREILGHYYKTTRIVRIWRRMGGWLRRRVTG